MLLRYGPMDNNISKPVNGSVHSSRNYVCDGDPCELRIHRLEANAEYQFWVSGMRVWTSVSQIRCKCTRTAPTRPPPTSPPSR